MHVTLTDILTCPRCGPQWGLILIAKRTENRRVLDGHFGCPNCRQQWTLKDGYADLVEGEAEGGQLGASSQQAALTIAAGLGVTEGPGMIMVIGSGAANAQALRALVEGVEVVAVSTALAATPEEEGISRVGAGERLPFREACARGVALTDAGSLRFIEQAARIVMPRARVMALSGDAEVAERMRASGLQVILADARVTVAQRAAI